MNEAQRLKNHTAKWGSDFLLFDSLKTIQDPHSSYLEALLAASSLIPAIKLEGKLTDRAFAEIARWSRESKFITEPFAKVVGKSEAVIEKLQSLGLNKKQLDNFGVFAGKAHSPSTLHKLENGSVLIQKFEPGRQPGRYAVYQKIMTKEGVTTYYGKISTDPHGKFLHGKIKYLEGLVEKKSPEKSFSNVKDFYRMIHKILKGS